MRRLSGALARCAWLGLALAFEAGCLPQPPSQPTTPVATPATSVRPAPSPVPSAAAEAQRAPERAAQIRARLLEEQDTDCDQRITHADQGTRRFQFRSEDQAYELSGGYVLGNLLLELTLGRRSGAAPRLDRVMEDPIRHTSRVLRTMYWNALTRRLDEDGLPRLLEDPGQRQLGERLLYVPNDDARALDYFQKVGRRYDAAYAKIERGTRGLPFVELLSPSAPEETERVLVAMLRTAEGRLALHELIERLGAVTRTLDYPALARDLGEALERITDLLESAERSCVHGNTLRLGRFAERTAHELQHFSSRRLSVRPLPDAGRWPEWTASLGRRHGLLSLALEDDPESGLRGVPFVVPGGSREEMPGWESYFIVLGLLTDERLDLARAIVDNAVYAVEHYAGTLSANRTYYLARSEPPFLTSMIRAVWDATPRERRDHGWLEHVLDAALYEYHHVWSSETRSFAALCRGEGDERACLAHYAGNGVGQPPEVEPGHFDWLWQQTGRSLERSYTAGHLSERNLSVELDRAFRHDRCMRESGHDSTYRWFYETEDGAGQMSPVNRCADMATVDLNSLLYKYEVDVAHLLRELLLPRVVGSELPRPASMPSGRAPVRKDSNREPSTLAPRGEPSTWCARARHRFELMKRHLWSRRDGLFYDAFVAPGAAPVQTRYVSATALYPLWATAEACEPAGAARPETLTPAEQSALVTNALAELEAPGGLLATAKASRDRFSTVGNRRWEYPDGLPPHQMLAWAALEAHGFHEDAQRLASSWLYTLLTNGIDDGGTIPNAYDVIDRLPVGPSRDADDGTGVDPGTHAGFGWMNASFQVGLRLLSPAERQRLEQAVAKR